MLARIDHSRISSPTERHQEGLMRQLVHESLGRLGSAYRDWRFERDITAIARVLERLNDRQLAILGLSRAMLAVDVERLAIRAGYDEPVTCPVTEDGDDVPRRDGRQDQGISLFHA